jgi:hypothetical protein
MSFIRELALRLALFVHFGGFKNSVDSVGAKM